jgi:hypothetical protein
MYNDIPSNYPATFFYNINKLQGAFSKNLIKVTADRVTASPQEITNIRLPIGALLNMDSFALWFKVTTSGTNVTIPARYASTFIKRLSLTMNNVSVQIIQDYNLVYNIANDHMNKDKTKGIGGEFLDNSIRWTEAAGSSDQTPITGASTLLAGTAHLNNEQFCINNWMGLFGSASTRILPSDRTGEITISVEWAPNYEVLGGTAEGSATTYTASDTYSISDIYFTSEAFSFSDDTYYNSIGDKDLKFGFNDYVVTKFANVQKVNDINVTTYLSAGSIDYVMGTALLPQSVPKPMVAYGSLGTGAAEANVANIYKYLSDPVTYGGNSSATPADNIYGDGFYSTLAMQRCLQHLDTSQWSINNKTLNYAPLNKYEVFYNNLLALGYENVDMSANGLSPYIVSLLHYFKYSGVCIQSLELIDKDVFYISGLSSAGSSCAVNWVAKFSGNSNTLSVVPVIIAKMSKVLHVKAGRQIMVE